MQMDDPTVTLAYGDGCGITSRFIRHEILTRFRNPILNLLEDGSWIKWDAPHVILSTDSFVVDPPVFPGGDIGKLAISGTVNDLLASGAVPRCLSLSLILTEGLPLDLIKKILDSAQKTALAANVQIVAGDTKVLERHVRAGLLINTTGIGTPIQPSKDYSLSRVKRGDSIIITGSVGDHGLAVLSVREGLGFEQRVQSDCAPLQELLLPVLRMFDGIRSMRDATRGGLLGVALDMTEASNIDILLETDAIPVKPDVRYGCEMLGLDPLTLVNEGKMVMAVAADQADDLLHQLRQHPLGKESAIIGRAQPPSSSKGRLFLKGNRSKRVVLRPDAQNLPRLC
jgi:hydrogenase expression/formation protein HypE